MACGPKISPGLRVTPDSGRLRALGRPAGAARAHCQWHAASESGGALDSEPEARLGKAAASSGPGAPFITRNPGPGLNCAATPGTRFRKISLSRILIHLDLILEVDSVSPSKLGPQCSKLRIVHPSSEPCHGIKWDAHPRLKFTPGWSNAHRSAALV
jgi:hypothetical protein